ncbi:hypothetical protein SAMN05428984_3508 [Sphingomonas sp. OK281]|nr:hypothetical protein SAMN05428984_3508 [Sphingomonas sp. OK281]
MRTEARPFGVLLAPCLYLRGRLPSMQANICDVSEL